MKTFHLDTRICMHELLRSSAFDSFLFVEGEVATFCSFHVDGRLHKEFFRQDADEEIQIPEREFILWKEVKDYFFSLIRGRRTPLHFKLIFALSQSNVEKLLRSEGLDFEPDAVQGLYLNFRYSSSGLLCITGTSLCQFTLDKSLEEAWDQMVPRFFSSHNIPFETE